MIYAVADLICDGCSPLPIEAAGGLWGDLFRCGHLTADNDDDEEELNKRNQA